MNDSFTRSSPVVAYITTTSTIYGGVSAMYLLGRVKVERYMKEISRLSQRQIQRKRHCPDSGCHCPERHIAV